MLSRFTDDAVLERVGPKGRAEALGVLLTGRLRAGEAVSRPFLDFAAKQDLDLSYLWMVREGRRSAVATLIVPGVGRTAMLFLSPLAVEGSVPQAGRLVGHAIDEIDPRRVNLVQGLLEPGQELNQRALEVGGMSHLADLAYMCRSGCRTASPVPTVKLGGRALEVTTWSDAARPTFARAILESYEDTLDCPGLRGLREIDDVIAGHQATGKFNPADWIVWSDEKRGPAAVLLLAGSSEGNGAELVYLGVVPWARRRGLARQIMEVALNRTARIAEAHGGGGDGLHLAVDDRNRPALKLYHDLGFRLTLHKTALIAVPKAAG